MTFIERVFINVWPLPEKSENGRILQLKTRNQEISNLTTQAGTPCAIRVLWQSIHGKRKILQRRLIDFGARTTRVANMLPKTDEGRHIAKQLMRSGLAAAPNYAEARAAESRADFIHKLRIVLKELNGTLSWLQQIVANGLFSRDKMARLIAENHELCWIIAASIKTARQLPRPI
jgi:four helix bundle protein